jgi:hypothetical protein
VEQFGMPTSFVIWLETNQNKIGVGLDCALDCGKATLGSTSDSDEVSEDNQRMDFLTYSILKARQSFFAETDTGIPLNR